MRNALLLYPAWLLCLGVTLALALRVRVRAWLAGTAAGVGVAAFIAYPILNPPKGTDLDYFWQGGVRKACKEPVTVYYSLDVVIRLLGLVDSRAARVADALSVQHVDVRPLLTLGLRHYYDHDHHTAAGAAVIARTVATALLSPPFARVPTIHRAVVATTHAP